MAHWSMGAKPARTPSDMRLISSRRSVVSVRTESQDIALVTRIMDAAMPEEVGLA